MRWKDGHEKMVSFGAGLEVPGNTRGLWCYYAKADEHSATYTGVPMSWEIWAAPLLDYLTAWRAARRWDMVEVM